MTRGKALRSPPRRWPIRWLMTDERMGERLFLALNRLPFGSGVVFRHYGLPQSERERLARSVARVCRRRGLVLAVANDVGLARRVDASLVHNPSGTVGLMPFSLTVHNELDARRARSSRAALVFVSPVFATKSHPGASALGVETAATLARSSGKTAIALGGMSEARFAEIRCHGFHGYAGIDCWTSN